MQHNYLQLLLVSSLFLLSSFSIFKIKDRTFYKTVNVKHYTATAVCNHTDDIHFLEPIYIRDPQQICVAPILDATMLDPYFPTWNYTTDGPVCKEPQISFFDKENRTLTIKCPNGENGIYRLSSINNKNATLFYLNDEEYIKDVDNKVLEDIFIPKADWIKYTGPVKDIEDELIEVRCGNKLHNFHYQLKLSQKSKDRINQKRSEKKKLNVLVFIIDMVSNNHFQRSMKETIYALEKIKKKGLAKVWKFDNYNSVDQNTPVNQTPMFAGNIFHSFSTHRSSYGNYGPADTWSFIWKYYAKDGYLTSYSIDASHPVWWWTKSPTDLFTLKRAFYDVPELTNWQEAPRCINNKLATQVQVDYVLDMWKEFPDIPKIAIQTASDGHETTWKVLSTVDRPAANLFEKMEPYLDDTVIFFLSDHGPHYGPFRSSVVGEIEHAFPFFYMITPNSLTKEYPEFEKALTINQRRLVTAYDIYATLKHILILPESPEPSNTSEGRKLIVNWASSLFHAIPGSRTCKDAHVLEGFCGCVVHELAYGCKKSVNDYPVEEVDYLSRYLIEKAKENVPACSVLSFSHTESVWRHESYEEGKHRYRFKVHTNEEVIFSGHFRSDYKSQAPNKWTFLDIEDTTGLSIRCSEVLDRINKGDVV